MFPEICLMEAIVENLFKTIKESVVQAGPSI